MSLQTRPDFVTYMRGIVNLSHSKLPVALKYSLFPENAFVETSLSKR